MVEKHKREKCKNNGTFPWQKSGDAEGGLDLGDKQLNNAGEEGPLSWVPFRWYKWDRGVKMLFGQMIFLKRKKLFKYVI